MNLKQILVEKRCIMVCGGGGVGKTTLSASLAVAGAHLRSRVLVLTIDPAKRLLQAFGFTDALLQEGGEPLRLSDEVKAELGLPASADLSVAILNPRYVLEQVMGQALPPDKGKILRSTLLYREMSQMIHGLQEYTAYEWVTRMLTENRYDLIVLDTPPAFHAKEFFNAPDKIRNLMESRVFQIFMPKKTGLFQSMLSLGWVEKLLGAPLFRESRLFFETFSSLRDRIVDRCSKLAVFFRDQSVGVVAVGTTESTPLLELEGISAFLKGKGIALQGIVLNQIEEAGAAPAWSPDAEGISPDLAGKLSRLREHQDAKAARCGLALERVKRIYQGVPVIPVPMVYAQSGFEILRENASRLA